jgi:hypothetical protein
VPDIILQVYKMYSERDLPQCICNNKELHTVGEKGVEGTDEGDDVTNVQYNSNWNCHEFLPPV